MVVDAGVARVNLVEGCTLQAPGPQKLQEQAMGPAPGSDGLVGSVLAVLDGLCALLPRLYVGWMLIG